MSISGNAGLELTAGLIAGEERRRAGKSLAHLLAQTAIERMEIVVVDVDSRGGGLAGIDHPRVRYFHRPDLRYFSEAQGEIARQAGAPLLAYIEDHSFCDPGWAEAILKAFGNPRVAAVSYTFRNANQDTYMSRSILVAEYGHWMAPHPGGPVSVCSSTNVAYRRDLLTTLLEGGSPAFEAEFLFHRALRKNGWQCSVAPEARVAHESWLSLGDACQANGVNKRALGARRAEQGGWGIPRRVLWAGGMTLGPPLFLARLGWALRRRPALWGRYLAASPVCLAVYSYCAWCEALGYLFGPGSSREEFRARELSVRRDG
jgi:hypothetical protein